MKSHEIDYIIYGHDMQFVEIELDPQETVIAEPGAMMMMNEAIEMNTIFGDGSGTGGNSILDKLFSAGKRVLTGENMFITAFTNFGHGKQHVSFSAPYPGTVWIQLLPLSRLANRIIASAPKAGGKRRGEGSILGGLGDLLDGDNRF